jgi:hypothetical protein
MHSVTSVIVYPEGEEQEIARLLRLGEMVGINAEPLTLPLRTHRMIAYRVSMIRKEEGRGETIIRHHLELLSAAELRAFSA